MPGGWTNDALTQVLNSVLDRYDVLGDEIAYVKSYVAQLPTTNTPTSTTPQAVNQIFNGSFTHSVQTWANVTPSGDAQFECKNWYSHPSGDNVALYTNDSTGNVTLNFTSADVTTGSPGEIAITNHGLANGEMITLSSGSPPSPLTNGTNYFVIVLDIDTIALATTYQNAIDGIGITLTTAGTGSSSFTFNTELKEEHSTVYNDAACDWSWTGDSAGCARMMLGWTVDALIPGMNIEPSYIYYGAFNIVRANQYITAQGQERIYSGLYAEQDGIWDWIGGPFEITAEVIGTVATPTSRDYRILAQTDRGFSILSDVLTVPSAPSDTDFGNGAAVYLSWRNVLLYGVQTYDIYRKTGSTYVLLQRITTGLTSTLDNGAITSTAVGWPTGDFDRLVAYTASIPNQIDQLPYINDPLNPTWASIPFAMRVPANYDMSTTDLSKGQWWRFGITGSNSLDLRLDDGMGTETSFTVTSAAGQFFADQVGLTIKITQGDLYQPSTIATYVSPTEITISDALPFDLDNAIIYITGGAPPHSIYVDLAHLDYQQGATFAPNAADTDGTHGTPPVVPNGSPQGGTGTGQPPGTIDGQPTCLFGQERVNTSLGEMNADQLFTAWKEKNIHLIGKDGRPRYIKNIIHALDNVWYLVTKNKVSLLATATKRVFTPEGKMPIGSLKVGDTLITKKGNRRYKSPIIQKTLFAKKQLVVQLELSPSDDFWAGTNGWILVSNAKMNPEGQWQV